jgi:hypothetical protein
MGLILDTDDEILGLEKRRESFNIVDRKRKYPHEIKQPPDLFKTERTVVRGTDRYKYAVKKAGEVWLECGDNQYKAERVADALNLAEREALPRPKLSEHIFASQDGEIEVSKQFLRKLVAFFDNPKSRRMLADDPLPKGYPAQGRES